VLKIAVTGASPTDKTELARALGHALKEAGRDALVAVTDSPVPSGKAAAREILTLLCGLESAEPALLAADQAIRSALAAANTPFCVVYGSTPQRLAQALGAVERLQPGLPPLQDGQHEGRGKAWVWVCDKCSDPACEHRLLSDLLAQRSVSAAL